jgi:hypothetical protein
MASHGSHWGTRRPHIYYRNRLFAALRGAGWSKAWFAHERMKWIHDGVLVRRHETMMCVIVKCHMSHLLSAIALPFCACLLACSSQSVLLKLMVRGSQVGHQCVVLQNPKNRPNGTKYAPPREGVDRWCDRSPNSHLLQGSSRADLRQPKSRLELTWKILTMAKPC